MRYNKVAAAKALGIGRNTILAYESSDAVPRHIELACAALACKIVDWPSIRDGRFVALRRAEFRQLLDQARRESVDEDEAFLAQRRIPLKGR